MSKESKKGKKNRKRILRNPEDKFKFPNVNPVYLLTAIGVIIAGLSLYYSRKMQLRKKRKPIVRADKHRRQKQRQTKNKVPKSQIIWIHFLHSNKNTGIYTFDD